MIMLEKSFGLMFFMRKPKNSPDGTYPIYLRITVDGKSSELSTKRKCHTATWNAKTGRSTGSKETIRELNSFLDALMQQVYQAKRRLMEADKELTSEAIKRNMMGTDEEKRTIIEVFNKHNQQLKALEGTEFARNTIKRYATTLEHTKSFLTWKYGTEDLDIRKLDHETIAGFDFWLKGIQKCNHNSTMKYLSNFKKIVLIAVKNKWLPSDPFANFKFTKKPVQRLALTDHELNAIATKNFKNERLQSVRDIFIFSCYTGLSYTDVQKLRADEIHIGIDKKLWIFTNRQKTGTATRLPLMPEALAIVEKYKKHPKCIVTGLLLPILSNQKMNSYLKEIADTCDIDKPLTFHIARHTFATTVTLNHGVPIETVSKILGHSSIKQTQHYAKLTDNKVSDDINQLIAKRKQIG
ncbi:site-specific integrase [Mucilaginibacter sp. cycad4]|uniref:site-specific integrase n=1 Tax=Mucilaginibacter sp. cycad4 TaxID=3342096 RepID=UPI002AAB0EE3|nr:site-specific integrase [Mucilaginibacter gossypii]WPV00731.1 site-specific integrase [Mucilaginibacter gossypii]